MVEEWNDKCPKCKAESEEFPVDEAPINYTQNRYLYKCGKCNHKYWVKQIDVLEDED